MNQWTVPYDVNPAKWNDVDQSMVNLDIYSVHNSIQMNHEQPNETMCCFYTTSASWYSVCTHLPWRYWALSREELSCDLGLGNSTTLLQPASRDDKVFFPKSILKSRSLSLSLFDVEISNQVVNGRNDKWLDLCCPLLMQEADGLW